MQFDINDEMTVTRFRNGIKLSCTDEFQQRRGEVGRPIIVVNHQMQQAFDVFYVLSDLTLARVNKNSATSYGMQQPEELVGKTVYDFFEKESAEYLVRYEMETVIKNKIMMREYDLTRLDGSVHHFLGLRAPWYDNNDQIIGVMGYAVSIGKHSLPDALTSFMKQGLIENPGTYSNYIHSAHLSKREMECLKLAVRGKTMREIGLFLGLSVRTIEAYMENIKLKFNVATKSELIDLVFDYFT